MAKSNKAPQQSAPFSFEGLDRVLHEKARLGILSSLVANPEGLLFTELKQLCRLTDGNLSRHLHILQEAELIELWKGHHQRRPQTLVRLTPTGRRRFLQYIELLEQIVEQTRKVAEQAGPAAQAARRKWIPG